MSEAKLINCPDCGKPVEVLMACGAKSYFCNHCNELKSSKRIQSVNLQTENPAVLPPKNAE